MVTVKHIHLKVPCDIDALKRDAHRILNVLDYSDFDLGILLTNDKEIQGYNRDYRKKDEPTDILSFPYHPKLKAGERIDATLREDKNLGDLIVSLEYIQPIAHKENKSINTYLQPLLCHGICHLLGYDHDSEETDKVMKAKERWLMEHCGE